MSNSKTIPPSRYSVPERSFDAARDFAAKRSVPVYLGELALELGLNLSQARTIADVLVARGDLRKLTHDEKSAKNIDRDAAMYVYVAPDKR